MEALTTILTTLQGNLMTLVVPMAVIGTVFWFIANALTPIIPDWAQGLRGYFQKLMLGVAVVGFCSTLIGGLFALGGGGAAPGGSMLPPTGAPAAQVTTQIADWR